MIIFGIKHPVCPQACSGAGSLGTLPSHPSSLQCPPSPPVSPRSVSSQAADARGQCRCAAEDCHWTSRACRLKSAPHHELARSQVSSERIHFDARRISYAWKMESLKINPLGLNYLPHLPPPPTCTHTHTHTSKCSKTEAWQSFKDTRDKKNLN